MRERIVKPIAESIDFFNGGVRITAPANVDLPHKGGGIRGDVRGWSSASRRRMREYLLEHQPLSGRLTLGISLTVPGPPITPEQSAHLFNHFSSHYLTRNECGMVWRLEVQERGSVHWHGILSSPTRLRTSVPPADLPAVGALYVYWMQALRVLGKCDWTTKLHAQKDNYKKNLKKGDVIETIESKNKFRDELPFANIRAVDIQHDGGRGAWLRYLQDHNTKNKLGQVAVGFGRHWGVVGRKYFQTLQPNHSLNFSKTNPKAFSKFLRAFHRLTQPVMSYRKRRELCRKFDNRPFGGRALGWSSPRGSRGVSVWFSKPETVRCLADWAQGS